MNKIIKAGGVPRALRNPQSQEYAMQTISVLKMYLEGEKLERNLIAKELAIIRQHRHWEVLGYETEEALLRSELREEFARNIIPKPILQQLNSLWNRASADERREFLRIVEDKE